MSSKSGSGSGGSQPNPNPAPGGGQGGGQPAPAPANPAQLGQAAQAANAYTLMDLIRDLNGDHPFSADQAAFGTVPSGYYLQLDAADTIPDELGETFVFNDPREFIQANYHALRGAGLTPNDAMFITLLRYYIVRDGWVVKDLKKRCVLIDEYEIDDYKQNVPRAIPPAELPTLAMTEFVGTYYENIVAVVAHIFRVRSHHWKPEYADLYAKTWRATTIEPPLGVIMPSWETIARAGLHCFGIRAIHMLVNRPGARLTAGLIIRLDAACAGTAAVRTAAAALREMASSTWFKAFYFKFEKEVDALIEEADRLRKLGIEGHICAGLYVPGAKYVAPNFDLVTPLAPFIMGWIDTLERSEPITKQAAITKRATGGSSVRREFSTTLLNVARGAALLQSVEAYLRVNDKDILDRIEDGGLGMLG